MAFDVRQLMTLQDIEGISNGINRNNLERFRQRIQQLEDQVELLRLAMSADSSLPTTVRRRVRRVALGNTRPFTYIHEAMPGWDDLGVRERSIIKRQTETDRVWALSEYQARHGNRCPTAFELARFLNDIEEQYRQRIKQLEDQVELLRLAMSAHDVLDIRI